MQVPILNGITTDGSADFRTSYPLNLEPVPKQTGISNGYLRTAPGMVQFADSGITGGVDRGAINWKGMCYRVTSDRLISVDSTGAVQNIGFLSNDGKRVSMVYSFDRLAIASDGMLYYYQPNTGVVQVTDLDLGTVVDVVWIAGYFMSTDGEFLVVTDLADPYSVNPLKYGSSEASPDKVVALLNIKNEVHAINRFTIEVFQNVGGTNFPFQRVESAMIPKGAVGTHAVCPYLETFAFVGGGEKEGVSVYIGGGGQSIKIATREIETLLQGYSEDELADLVIESRSEGFHEFLYVHLPDKTAVYDATGSQGTGEPVWFYLSSGADGDQAYRARNYVYCYGEWLFGDLNSSKIGRFTNADARQFGETVPWQFDVPMLFNEGKGAIIHEMELVRLPGRQLPAPSAVNVQSVVSSSYTEDGLTYSQQVFAPLSRPGDTRMRCTWFGLGYMENFRSMRFRGMNNPYPDSFSRLDVRVEALNV